jgi:hypothetical protein
MAVTALVTSDQSDVSVSDGATPTDTGTFSGDHGTATLTPSVGTLTQDNTDDTWSWSGPVNGENPYSVTVSASFSDGNFALTTFNVNFADVAPSVAADQPSVSAPENAPATDTGTFSDFDDAVTITASSGDVTQTGSLSGTWAWSGTGDEGHPYTVTVTATNADGSTAATSFQVSFTGVTPSVAADQPSVSAPPSTTATNTGTYSLYGGTVSVSGPGVVDNGDGTWAWSGTTVAGAPYTVTVTATNSDGATATTSFTVDPAPAVSSISPAAGPPSGGTSVTLTGSGFTGATRVLFGPNPSPSFVVNSDGHISAVSPSGSVGRVNVVVVTPYGVSAKIPADVFGYQGAPTVTSLSSTSGPAGGGKQVIITGTNFYAATAVHFGSAPAASFSVASPTAIVAVTPATSAGSVDVTVTTPVATSADSAADHYVFLGAPSVTSISPAAGPTGGGTSVTISGLSFTGATRVLFGPAAATSFTVNSDSQITAVSPSESAGRVHVVVVTPLGVSAKVSADVFGFQDVPTVASLNSSDGPAAGGRQVVISGTNFYAATAVDFGSTPAASFSVASPTTVVAVTPADTAGPEDVTVTTPVGTSATSPSDQYVFIGSPAVTSVSPGSGSVGGGTSVTITGSGFTGATQVWFGPDQAPSFTVHADGLITAVTPAESAGTWNVVVVTPGGVSPRVPADDFTFEDIPTVTSLSSSSGPAAGGKQVVITGTGFVGAETVSFGATPASSFTVGSATTIVATTPAESSGLVHVTVTTPLGTSTVSAADQYGFS